MLLNQTTTTTQSLLPPVELEHLLDHELWLTGLRLALKLLVVAAAANQARTRSLVHDGALLVEAALNLATLDLVGGRSDGRLRAETRSGLSGVGESDAVVGDVDRLGLDGTLVSRATEALDRFLLAFRNRRWARLLQSNKSWAEYFF